MKLSSNTSVSMPIKNMIGIIAAVSAGIFAYTELTARLTSLETSRELHQADLLKKSEQLPTDQEQFILLEHIAGQVEEIENEMKEMRNNTVNIDMLIKNVDRIRDDVEKLKDKVRDNGNH